MKGENRQTGFTLIELLIAMAISVILMGGVVAALFQTLKITGESRIDIVAMENIKNSAYWISKDIRMASTTNLVSGGPAQGSLILDWVSWYGTGGYLASTTHHAVYQLSGMKLRRTFDYGSPQTVADYIATIQFSLQGQMVYATITSNPGISPEMAQSVNYKIYLQPKMDAQR